MKLSTLRSGFPVLSASSWFERDLQTLLYMLLQHVGTGTIPPSTNGFATPAWDSLADAWNAASIPLNSTVTLRPATIELGHDNSEADDVSLEVKDHDMGWDNEHPRHNVDIGKFRIKWRPVTNGQFHEFWKEAGGKVALPKSWVMDGDNIKVGNPSPITFLPLRSPSGSYHMQLRRSALSVGRFRSRLPTSGLSLLTTIVSLLTLPFVAVTCPRSLNSASSTTSLSVAMKVDETSGSATGTLFREHPSCLYKMS